MCRRPRKLPTACELLKPMAYDHLKAKNLLDKTKHTQKLYHDHKRAGRPRTDLQPGDEVRMTPYPGNQRWTPGVIVQPHSAPQSYIVDTGVKVFCRNSQHLRASTEATNQSRHVLCDDERQPPEPPAAKEQQPPAVPPDLQVSPQGTSALPTSPTR